MTVCVDQMAIATSDPVALDEAAGFDEVGDDALRSVVRDARRLHEVSHADIVIARDAEQYLGVVGDETPGLLPQSLT